LDIKYKQSDYLTRNINVYIISLQILRDYEITRRVTRQARSFVTISIEGAQKCTWKYN